jgi:hypothetical protein
MYRHLYVVRTQAAKPIVARPAKVVQLDVRRQARLDAARDLRRPPRPAA